MHVFVYLYIYNLDTPVTCTFVTEGVQVTGVLRLKNKNFLKRFYGIFW